VGELVVWLVDEACNSCCKCMVIAGHWYLGC
jgi:hypothetical protein